MTTDRNASFSQGLNLSTVPLLGHIAEHARPVTRVTIWTRCDVHAAPQRYCTRCLTATDVNAANRGCCPGCRQRLMLTDNWDVLLCISCSRLVTIPEVVVLR